MGYGQLLPDVPLGGASGGGRPLDRPVLGAGVRRTRRVLLLGEEGVGRRVAEGRCAERGRVGLSESETRLALLWRTEAAAHTEDRRRADRLMVEATRWLKEHPNDAVVSEAREDLRRAFPPDSDDTVSR